MSTVGYLSSVVYTVQCEHGVSGSHEESGEVTARYGCAQHCQRTASTGAPRRLAEQDSESTWRISRKGAIVISKVWSIVNSFFGMKWHIDAIAETLLQSHSAVYTSYRTAV